MQRDPSLLLFGQKEDQYTYRGIFLFLGIYFGAILFAGIVAPWLYWSIGWLNSLIEDLPSGSIPAFESSFRDLFGYLSQKSFADYFDRLRWLPVVFLLPWLIRKCGLMSWHRLGVTWDTFGAKQCISGFSIGVGLVLILIVGQVYSFPISERKEIDLMRVLEVVILSLLSGFLLGLLEEIIFRGLVFRVFYTAIKPWSALVLGSLLFSYCHFKFPEALWSDAANVSIWSGLYIGFWTIFGIFYNLEWVVFLNLFLLGVLLIYFVLEKRTLMYSVGFHAGIVFCMLTYKRLWILQDDGESFFWGSPKMTDGLACAIILSILILYFVLKRKIRKAH